MERDGLDHGTHDPPRCRICQTEATFGPGDTFYPSVPATGATLTIESSEVWKCKPVQSVAINFCQIKQLEIGGLG